MRSRGISMKKTFLSSKMRDSLQENPLRALPLTSEDRHITSEALFLTENSQHPHYVIFLLEIHILRDDVLLVPCKKLPDPSRGETFRLPLLQRSMGLSILKPLKVSSKAPDMW